MAATIAWQGYGNVATADSTTGWTALKISGTGGGPTAAVADGQIEGTGAVTCVVSKQRVALYFDIGSGNELDFSGGGAEENEFVYIWANFLATALLQNQSAGGFGIFLETLAPTTSQYHLWYVEGADTYDGGWRRFALDPTKTVSASAGTALNLASVRYFGIFADVGGTTARFDNLICDAIDVGTGLKITGTSTSDDLSGDLLTNEDTNRYGIFTEKLGVAGSGLAVELAGKLTLGDNSGTASTVTSDVDTKIFAAEPTYYQGGVVAALPLTAIGVECVGNATGGTNVIVGKSIGSGDTETGRNGWSVIGNSTYDVGIDWDDNQVNFNRWYGCSFENLTGSLSWGSNATHRCVGNTFSGCSQFIPLGDVKIRNCNFVSLADISGTNQAALLWNSVMDIKNCNFANNTLASANVGHDIEIPTSGFDSFSGLVTSGAEQEILFSAASGNLSVLQSGGSTFSTTPADHTVVGTGSITVLNNVATTFTGLPDTTEIRVYDNGDDSLIASTEDATTGSPGDRSYTFSDSAANDVRVIFINVDYLVFTLDPFIIPSDDVSIPITLFPDRTFENP